MTNITSARWAAIGAFVFAVAFVATNLLLAGQVEENMSAKDFADTYDKAGGRAIIITAAYVGLVATAFLGLFIVHWLGRLRAAEGGDAPLTRLGELSAAAIIATWVVALFAQANVAAAIQFGGFDVPSPETAVFFSQFGTGLVLVGTMFSSAALMALTAMIAFRTGAFPRWLAWLSVVTAVVSLFGAFFIPALALPVWLVAVGVHTLRVGDPAA